MADDKKAEISADVWAKYIECVEEITIDRLTMVPGDEAETLMKFLIDVKHGTRPHILTYGSNAAELWAMIEKKGAVLDFILSTTNEALLRVLRFDSTYDKLVLQLAFTLSFHTRFPNGSTISKSIREQLPNNNESKALIQSNPWLLTIFALCYSRGVSKLVKVDEE